MAKYVFSQGQIRVLDGIVLRPEKHRHPLRMAIMFIACNPENVARPEVKQQSSQVVQQEISSNQDRQSFARSQTDSAARE